MPQEGSYIFTLDANCGFTYNYSPEVDAKLRKFSHRIYSMTSLHSLSATSAIDAL